MFYNKILVAGEITSDIDFKEKSCSFDLNSKEFVKGGGSADIVHKIVFLSEYQVKTAKEKLKKGDKIFVEGSLRYVAKEIDMPGYQKTYSAKLAYIQAYDFKFVYIKKSQAGAQAQDEKTNYTVDDIPF